MLRAPEGWINLLTFTVNECHEVWAVLEFKGITLSNTEELPTKALTTIDNSPFDFALNDTF